MGTQVERLGRSGDRHVHKTIGVRFPTDLHKRLRAAAFDREVSINWLVNRAVAEYLDRLIPADEIRWTRDPGPRTGDPG